GIRAESSGQPGYMSSLHRSFIANCCTRQRDQMPSWVQGSNGPLSYSLIFRRKVHLACDCQMSAAAVNHSHTQRPDSYCTVHAVVAISIPTHRRKVHLACDCQMSAAAINNSDD